ncbi:MFS transporter [Oceanobacillus piezotolerans]|uniref:MFS transporter n=1 Tax=Oceanobacillus piezotolerans TaxID=2448030 RepID=A0A498D104_9BACI|nr:glycoside-pentoside-hexuronide (GPH):cation symporter [Oceanobacillus piezotolerans]RLL39944.1 MFS transporter [Oceanobacillus piezotolerans]
MHALQHDYEQKNQQNNNVRPFGLRDKFGYLFGDFGNDFFFILAASYLMVFYTDIFHISAGAVGVLFMIARVWDAFADVLWGRFIDTRKTTKMGKFRPWIFRMSFPLVIMGVLMFVKIPGMSDGFYLAWAFVTYILWGTLYATVNIPYGSMASVMTSDPVERTSLSAWRSLGATMAGLIINVGGPLLLFVNNEPSESRFLMTAILFGILAIACYMACVALTTERITAPEREPQKGDFKKTVQGLGKNKPLLWILVASLVFMVTTLLIGSVNVYLFKDYFGNTTALSVLGFVQTAVVFVAMPMINPLVKRFGKKEVGSTGLALAAIAYLLLFFLPNVNETIFIILSGVGLFASYGLFNLIIWAFVTDVIDYHELLTGLREDGTVYSIYSFARKIGQAIAGGVSAFAIGAVGYDATKAAQSEATLDGMYSLATLVPGVLFAIAFVALVFFYPLTKQRTLKLAEDLSEKREENN